GPAVTKARRTARAVVLWAGGAGDHSGFRACGLGTVRVPGDWGDQRGVGPLRYCPEVTGRLDVPCARRNNQPGQRRKDSGGDGISGGLQNEVWGPAESA